MGTYVIDEQNMKTQTEPNQKDDHYHEEVEGRSEDVLEPREGWEVRVTIIHCLAWCAYMRMKIPK